MPLAPVSMIRAEGSARLVSIKRTPQIVRSFVETTDVAGLDRCRAEQKSDNSGVPFLQGAQQRQLSNYFRAHHPTLAGRW